MPRSAQALHTSLPSGANWQDCAQVALGAGVLVDAMGSFSPIARQARRGAKPDSVVLMVGSCATGLPAPHGADLLYSFTHLDRRAIP